MPPSWTGLPGTYDRGSVIKYLTSIKDPARLQYEA